MKYIALISIVFIMATACTKKAATTAEKSQYVDFESPIKYQVGDIQDKTQAAMVGDQPVSWEQLKSQDPALVELQKKYEDRGLGFAYAWAASMMESGQTVEVTVFIPKTDEELKSRLAVSSVPMVDGVTVNFADSTDPAVLATANGKNVTWTDFQNSNIQNSKLYSNLFQQRMRRLNGIVIRRYLLEAAKAKDIHMEEYVKQNIIPQALEPTDADVKAFAAEKGIQDNKLDENMVKRLKDILRQNDRDQKIANYVAKNLVKKPITVDFAEPKMQVKTPELSESMPQWGEKGPELVFVGHWDCDNCPNTLKSFLQTKEALSKSVTGAFIYSFPERNRSSRMGAEAALCVKAQKEESFWVFLNKVMDINEDNLEEKINLAAQGSNIDYDQFRNCFLKREFQDVVDSHLIYAKSLGITTAPLMILQGTVLDLPIDTTAIKSKLQELGVKTVSKPKGLWAKIKSMFGF